MRTPAPIAAYVLALAALMAEAARLRREGRVREAERLERAIGELTDGMQDTAASR
jgi:hypothetical protein